MKHQALFSSKDISEKIKVSSGLEKKSYWLNVAKIFFSIDKNIDIFFYILTGTFQEIEGESTLTREATLPVIYLGPVVQN